MKYIQTFVFIIATTYILNAQEIKKVHYSSWNTINIEKDFNSKWSVGNEFNFRRTNFLSNWEQFILRPSIHYKPDKDLDLALGYSYIKNFHFSDYSTPINAIENNIFQQVTLNHKFSKYSFAHRLRFEERFIDNVIATDNGYRIDGVMHKNRFRYKFQLTIPLIQKEKLLNLLMYDEAFLDFGNRLRPEKLDQNWMFFGVSFNVNNHVKVRTGYHDIYIPKTNITISNKIWETTLTYKI